ncbi:hypothetical protein ACI2IP_05450 [Microbacterium sp. NPDC090218]
MTTDPRSDLPPTRRGRGNPSAVLSMIGAVAVGCAVTWWITVAQRVPVQSDADLASVRFGFPVPWVTQDHSSNPFVAYPNEVALRLTGRTGISYPTDYGWLPFVGDVLIWGVVFWAVGIVGIPALVRSLRPDNH